MKPLFAIQILLGIFKVCIAFTKIGSKRLTWHICSGLAITAMGIAMLAAPLP